MRVEEIREVVKITLEELLNANALSDPFSRIKQIVEHELGLFFNSSSKSKIGSILNQLSDDEYIDIIFLYYRDNKTLDFIAEYFDRDITTISRNKRRLILAIYNLLKERESF